MLVCYWPQQKSHYCLFFCANECKNYHSNYNCNSYLYWKSVKNNFNLFFSCISCSIAKYYVSCQCFANVMIENKITLSNLLKGCTSMCRNHSFACESGVMLWPIRFCDLIRNLRNFPFPIKRVYCGHILYLLSAKVVSS